MKSNGNIKNFRIAFDSGRNWNNGTGDPATNEVDAWGVAAHEFGHGGGGWLEGSIIGHFNNMAMCPGTAYPSWQTMCAAVDALVVGDDERGKRFRRTLEEHDKHSFSNAY